MYSVPPLNNFDSRNDLLLNLCYALSVRESCIHNLKKNSEGSILSYICFVKSFTQALCGVLMLYFHPLFNHSLFILNPITPIIL